jgi:hypothetical protein
VERPAEPKAVEPLTAPAQLARQALRDRGDPSRMATEIWIPGLERR